MKTVRVTLESVAPYSQSRFHETAKLEREQPDAYEARTWREHLHYDKDGHVFIPPMALKNSLGEAAKYLSTKIPGKGNNTYTKHIEAGLLIFDKIMLFDVDGKPIHKDSVQGEWLFLDANGKKGSGTRVKRCYPRIDEWVGEAIIHIGDEIVTRDVLEMHLKASGNFIGMGRFRPRQGGFYGRYQATEIRFDS